MVRDLLETETLARLYLKQGLPERAATIYKRLLSEDPASSSAIEGIRRCRSALDPQRAQEVDMADKKRRLQLLQSMLARLTDQPESSKFEQPTVALSSVDLRRRKIEILQNMLQRLTQHNTGGQQLVR